MRKYEQIQKDPELTTNYKIMIKTGPGQYGGTNSEVYILKTFHHLRLTCKN